MALAGPDGSRGILHPQSIRCAMIPYANSWSRRLIVLGLNATGLALLLSLPAIWLSWSQWGLGMVLCTGLVAAVLHCLLAGYDEARGGATLGPAGRRARTLDTRMLSEMSSLGPYVYHNRSTPGRQFQSRMDRLKEALQRRG